jgi:hypothetical protein
MQYIRNREEMPNGRDAFQLRRRDGSHGWISTKATGPAEIPAKITVLGRFQKASRVLGYSVTLLGR